MNKAIETLEGEPRFLLNQGEDYLQLQKTVDQWQRVEWIQALAPWEVMATFTFRWQAGIYSAQRVFEKWMRKRLPGVSYYEAIEANPGRDGFHVHSLWADCSNVHRKGEWQDWFSRYGRALIEPVRCANDVSGYASKYLSKEDAWWNVKLQWHRHEALRAAAFKLSATV